MTSVLAVLGVLALAALTAAAGIGIVWWSLFGDKARGRRRCPRCWHDLSGTPGLVCGECGFEALHEEALWRTRRRWRVAVVSLLLILGFAGWARLHVLNSGWASLVPDRVLVAVASSTIPPSAAATLWLELESRAWAGELEPALTLELASTLAPLCAQRGRTGDEALKMLAGILDRRPLALESTYGMSALQMQRMDAEYLAFLGALDRILAQTSLILRCQLPQAWPAGEAPLVTVEGALLGVRTEWRVRVDGTDAPWTVWNSLGTPSYERMRCQLALPSIATQGTTLRARILAESRRHDAARGEWTPWVQEPAVELESPIAWIDGAPLQPDADPRLTRLVSINYMHPVTIWEDESRPIGVRYGARYFDAQHLSNVLIGVVVEVREAAVVRRRTRFWWRSGSADPRIGWSTDQEDLPALRRLAAAARALVDSERERSTAPADAANAALGGADAAAADAAAAAYAQLPADLLDLASRRRGLSVPGWTISVRGDRTTALRALPNDASSIAPWRWWSGEIEFPLEVEVAGTPAPPRAMRREPVDAPTPRDP